MMYERVGLDQFTFIVVPVDGSSVHNRILLSPGISKSSTRGGFNVESISRVPTFWLKESLEVGRCQNGVRGAGSLHVAGTGDNGVLVGVLALTSEYDQMARP